MAAAFLIALQAAAAPASPAPAPVAIDFDLARLARAEDCTGDWSAVIVVCGRLSPRDAFPMAEMARRYERRPLRAELDIGGATARAYAEQVDFGQGRVSNRIMIGVRTRF